MFVPQYDDRLIKNDLLMLYSTNRGERRDPNYGTGLVDLLFEPISSDLPRRIRSEIIAVTNRYEPRVTLKSVDVTANREFNSYTVDIVFYLNNSKPNELSMKLRLNQRGILNVK